MLRKASQADAMFTALVTHMHEGQTIKRNARDTAPERMPTWL
jgi:hypothetical protein